MEQYAEEYQHRAPEAPRTQYLPIANNGDIDTPDGATAPNAVDVLDRKLDKINDTTMNYDPEGLYSFCDDGCGGGCVKSAQHVPNLATEGVLTAMQHFVDALGITTAALQQHGGEQNVDRIAAVYGDEGWFDLAGIANRTNEVAKSYTDTMTSAHSSAQSALEAVRLTVKNERSKLAEKADVVHWNAKEIAGEIGFNGSPAALMKVAPRLVGGPWMLAGGAAASLAVDWWKRRKAQGLGPEVIEQGQKAAQNAIGEHAKAIEAFREEIKKLAVVPNTEIASLPTPKADEAKTVSKTDPAKPEDTPAPAMTDPLPGTPPADDKPQMTDQAGLDSLFPKMNDGAGGGSPMGGGMPDMGGGSPMGGMPQMGGQPTDPFADKPLDDAEDEEDPFEDEDGDQDEAKDGDEDAETNPDDDTETKPDNATDQPVTEPGDATDPPVQSTTEPVAATADPESEEARTATLPDGRSVTFPTAHQAEVARSMTEAAASGNPKSLYMAASEAGYDLPPQGQDIGEKVPPALMKEGDILSTTGGQGMYVGNGDVLMENGEISKLSDVANFDGESQGVFRMAEPDDHTGPGLEGPAQAVSADVTPSDTGTVSGDATTTTSGTPGVPTDTAAPVQDTGTSLGSGNGLSSSGGAMDPNSAFPS
ncbi:hypothetical protein KIH27_16070 [Mycobacterium sp. M1]|uniref:ESX-1 secretion-associated protein EspA/EspE-like domain-containing protein n=1 Tax=Mycolicibacter acidiphilus TaxID=2835306 RepID=A0ABS5RLD1_9MYCO|nr:hypothetical protein [Mycolicibacter acidiphilus]MBS9535105.1 hypothetical protein [Mycolicibacter acidiphilus]